MVKDRNSRVEFSPSHIHDYGEGDGRGERKGCMYPDPKKGLVHTNCACVQFVYQNLGVASDRVWTVSLVF